MFGKAKRARQEVIRQFHEIAYHLHHSEPATQVAVGFGVNKAWELFSQRFDGLSDFLDRPYKERMKYLESLAATSAKLGEHDPQAALGFDLFKMWLVAVMQKDKELGDKVTEMLEWLSKKAPHV